MNKAERKKVLDRYLLVFSHLDENEMADHLEIAPRTMKRLVSGDSQAPHIDTAIRMQESCDNVATVAQMSDSQLAERAEQARIKNERYQRQIRLTVIKKSGQIEIPSWFDFAAQQVEKGEYGVAYDLLIQTRENEKDWQSTPDNTKPYVLSYLSIACYYTGRIDQALEYALECEDSISKCGTNDPQLRKVNYLNKASLYMRKGNEEEAFRNIDDCLHIDEKFMNPLITVFCICDTFRNEYKLLHWIVKSTEIVKNNFTVEELQEFIERITTDPDLKRWVSKQNQFEYFVKDLRSLLETKKAA